MATWSKRCACSPQLFLTSASVAAAAQVGVLTLRSLGPAWTATASTSSSNRARAGCAMALIRQRLLISVDPGAVCDDRVRLLNGDAAETRRTNGDGGCAVHAVWGEYDTIAHEYRQRGARDILRREFGDAYAQFCINVGDATVASTLMETMWKEEVKPCAQSLVIAIPCMRG